MIGILDSGIGGIITARKIMERFPGYDITYFGDTARAPYGNKSADTIIQYALENTDALLAKGAKMIIITSHTVSCIASQHVRAIVDIPVLETLTPTIRLALNTTTKVAIGVMASRASVSMNIHQQEIMKIKPDARVYSVACPLLVPLVEEGWLKKPETVKIVKKYLQPLKLRQLDTLILGCAQFSVLKKIIQRKIGKRVHIIDATDAAAEAIGDWIRSGSGVEKTLSRQGKYRFFVSDLTENLLKTARSFAGKNIQLDILRKKSSRQT